MQRLSSFFVTLMVLVLAPLLCHAGGVRFHHVDILGSTVATSDLKGDVQNTYRYYPYGERIDNPADATDMAYTGKELDEESGLIYMNQRFYDPLTGRFNSMDPLEFRESNTASFNRYVYANNSPYKYVDPDGRNGVAAFGGLLYESAQFVSGNGFNGSAILGALVDGYNGEGAGFANAAFEDAMTFIPAEMVLGAIIKVARIAKNAKRVETIADVAENAPKVGDKVFRVWGDEASAGGRSWTRTDPRTVENYRDAAGLPEQNTGRFVTEGTLIDTKGISQREALELHGNKGGLDELVVPAPATQISIDRVYGVNPEF